MTQSPASRPSPQVEAVIQEVWGDVLGLEPASISVTADFFSEGGSSLKAGIIQAQLRTRLRVPALGGIALMQARRGVGNGGGAGAAGLLLSLCSLLFHVACPRWQRPAHPI